MKIGLYGFVGSDISKSGKLDDDLARLANSGVEFIQLREKKLNKKDLLEQAERLSYLSKKLNVKLIINDFIDVAKKTDASGVHLGQNDGSILEARKVLKGKIIGISARTFFEAKKAEEQGADYIGFGSMFETRTKKDFVIAKLEDLKNCTEEIKIPIVAIGGIELENVKKISCFTKNMAVISAIYRNNEIEKNIKKFNEKIAL